MRLKIALFGGLLLVAVLLTGLSLGLPNQPDAFTLSWWTVDGGGAASTTGGTYTLGGSIGQPDAGKLTGSTYTLNGGYWAGSSGGGTIYLPAVMRDVTACYSNARESEPNDSTAQANGPLCSGQTVLGYPDDLFDIFTYQHTSTGQIKVELTNHTGTGVQLSLYNGLPLGNPTRIGFVSSAPYTIDLAGQPAGLYYITIFTASGFNTSTDYVLKINVP